MDEGRARKSPPRERGHPLPASAEARHGEIPEGLERAKGRGDDVREPAGPSREAVGPDGETYEMAVDRRDGSKGSDSGVAGR